MAQKQIKPFYKAVLIQESGIRVCNPQPLLFFENFLLEYSVRLYFVPLSQIPVQIDAEMILCEGVEEWGFCELLFFKKKNYTMKRF